MLPLIRITENFNVDTSLKIIRRLTSSAPPVADENEFRILQLIPQPKNRIEKKEPIANIKRIAAARNKLMPDSKNWQAIWPVARTFHPHTVPLPVRQGYKNLKGMHPDKYANTELMKIPNFLHLTTPVIERHCKALAKFCTKWPKELEMEEECRKHFPVEIITSDYCYASPTIREPLARIVSLRVKLSSLHLDAHAKDKILRLLGERYNHKTDTITIVADRCPVRKQNLDYVKYLLTALFHVSWRVEPWEKEKSELDMEYYEWDKSKSKESLLSLYSWPNSSCDNDYKNIPHANEYRQAVSDMINKGEDQDTIDKYKVAVKNLLHIKSSENTC